MKSIKNYYRNNKYFKAFIHGIFWSIIATIIFLALALIFWKDRFLDNLDDDWAFVVAGIAIIFVFVSFYVFIDETKKQKTPKNDQDLK